MLEHVIPLYAHPTTVIVVDDNDLFLQTLDLRMPADMACLSFHNPRRALERINDVIELAPIPERCFLQPVRSLHWHDSIIQLDLTLIEQELNNMQRFRRTSVVVADYAMPAVDGLSFLTGLKDPWVKTVLMSGASDQLTAVKAFNEGAIDRYVTKGRSTTLDLVVQYAEELQREYFLDQQRAIQESLSLNPPKLLEDVEVSRHFAALKKKHGFVEHYLIGDPPGFVFVTANGEVRRLIVLSDTEVSEQVEYAANHDAPNDVIRALATRSRIGFFCERAETYGDEPYPWRDFLYAPTRLEGAEVWWSALVTDPPTDIDFRSVDSSFEAYLEEIDAKI
jgi:CheY-like chemotaxis protein